MVYKDIISGAVLLALSLAYYRIGAALPTSFLDTAVSSSTFPKMIGAAGVVLSAILLGRGIWRRLRPTALDLLPQPEEDWPKHLKALGLLLIASSYLLLLQVFGYVVAVGVLFAAIAIYNGIPPGRNLFAVTGAAVGVFWLFFIHLLGISMPSGSLWRALGIV